MQDISVYALFAQMLLAFRDFIPYCIKKEDEKREKARQNKVK